MRVVTGKEMQLIDREAIEKYSIASLNLMQRAGTKVAQTAQNILAGGKGRNVVVVSGSGNNGGDGFVAARLLHEVGFSVKVFVFAPNKKLSSDASTNFAKIKDLTKATFLSQETLPFFLKATAEADLTIDAIFGTGFSGKPGGLAKKVIEVVNKSGAEVLSVDIPSGVEADTGRVYGEAVKATRTVTFGLPKLGCLTSPGASFTGSLSVADIGFPSQLLERKGYLNLATPEELSRMLPERKPDAHKKECGMVFVLAGSVGMTGAAAMTSQTAMRAGAGIVTLGIPESLNDIMEAKLTEVMTYPLAETAERTLDAGAYHQVMEKLEEFDVLAIGPGLTQHESTVKLVRDLLENVKLPVVLDADGLNALVGQTHLLKKRAAETVITPHPGELGRLVGKTAAEVQEDRVGFAKQAATQWRVVTVLKGTRSVIAEPGGEVFINSTGNSGMASAGTGDVLTGIISSLWAQGLNAVDAAVLGTYLHGLAGDMVAKDKTIYSLIATDLIEYLPKAIRSLIEQTQEA